MLSDGPTSDHIPRRLSGRSRIGLAPSQNLNRSHKRLGLAAVALNPGPAHAQHGVPASVAGHFELEGGVLRLPFELTAEDAARLGAALILAARQALGASLPSLVEGRDAAAVIELGQALDALRGPRL